MKIFVIPCILLCLCLATFAQNTLSKEESQTYINEYYAIKSWGEFKDYYNLTPSVEHKKFFDIFFNANHRYDYGFHTVVVDSAIVTELQNAIQIDSMLYIKCKVSVKEHVCLLQSYFKNSRSEIIETLGKRYDVLSYTYDTLRTVHYRTYDSIRYSDSTLHGRGEDLFIFYKNISAKKWKVLCYTSQNISYFFDVIPQEVFYKIEGLDKSDCESMSLGLEELGDYIFNVISTGYDDKIYCKVGLPYTILRAHYFRNNKFTHAENLTYFNMIEQKNNIEYRIMRHMRSLQGEKYTLNKLYTDTIQVAKGGGFFACPMMLEMEIDGKTRYLEIICTSLDKKAWYISQKINERPQYKPYREIVTGGNNE